MRFLNKKQNEIKDFILKNIETHPTDITKFTVEKLNISRQTAYNYAKILEKESLIEIQANGRSPQYKLKEFITHYEFNLADHLSEDDIWRNHIAPNVPPLTSNIKDICNYGFTEMVNNVLDHSESPTLSITLGYNANKIWLWVFDNGVGIFKKIQKDFNLEDPRHAILELAKGKLTSQPANHSGYGIFFTSRMFDEFDILSGNLFFTGSADHDYLSDTEKPFAGTAVYMMIGRTSLKTLREIFDRFSDDDLGFSKTTIPVKLMQYEGENLVSRSQAKRLISRFEKFKEVMLDFSDVVSIGQAFADQIFRVFALQHPAINLIATNATPDILKMISSIKSSIPQENQEITSTSTTSTSSSSNMTSTLTTLPSNKDADTQNTSTN